MSNQIQISIIIPASFELDKAIMLAADIGRLTSSSNIKEIIIVTSEQAGLKRNYNISAKTVILQSKPQRAAAMNVGSKFAKGELLYFLHADSQPPIDFDISVLRAYASGSEAGCFRLKFDDNNLMLKLFAFFARLPWYWAHYGDQSLFTVRKLFNQVGGFDESLTTMEDIDLVKRIKQQASFKVIDKYITTSARKYRQHGYYKVQAIFVLVVLMYLLGFTQKSILKRLDPIKN